eukprot:scaffold284467_cov39-Prasinocladus_malaysianus.AAC.1
MIYTDGRQFEHPKIAFIMIRPVGTTSCLPALIDKPIAQGGDGLTHRVCSPDGPAAPGEGNLSQQEGPERQHGRTPGLLRLVGRARHGRPPAGGELQFGTPCLAPHNSGTTLAID